jgi:hypothetical protein
MRDHVSEDRREEMLLVGSPRGAHEATWTEADSYYEFRLYNSDHTRARGEVIVTKSGNKNDC